MKIRRSLKDGMRPLPLHMCDVCLLLCLRHTFACLTLVFVNPFSRLDAGQENKKRISQLFSIHPCRFHRFGQCVLKRNALFTIFCVFGMLNSKFHLLSSFVRQRRKGLTLAGQWSSTKEGYFRDNCRVLSD